MNAQLAAKLKGVPSLAQIFADHPPKGQQAKKAAAFLSIFATYPATVFTTPTGVSADKIAALRAALQFAIKDKATQAAAVAADSGYGYLSGAQVKADFLKATTDLHLLSPYVPKV